MISLVGWMVVPRMLRGPNGLQIVPTLQSDTRSHIVCLVLSGCALLLGLGLLWRRSIPRSLCMILSLLLLGASVVSTYTYFKTTSELTNTQQTYASQMQELSKQYLDNTGIAPAVRTGEAQEVVATARQEKLNDEKRRYILVSLIAMYILAITLLAKVGLPQQKARLNK